MSDDPQRDVRCVEDVLDCLEHAANEHRDVSVEVMLDSVGRRSFGPILILVGLLVTSPLSGIPGMPSTSGVLVVLLAVQFLFHREHLWLPGWIQRRTLRNGRIKQATRFLRRPARFLDRILKPRLTFMTDRLGAAMVILVCAIISLTMPPLELLPFSTSIAGAVLTIFGLALVANDGVVAILALGLTFGSFGLLVMHLTGA